MPDYIGDKAARCYIYVMDTGEILTEIKAPYRWILRHIDQVTKFSITETRSGGAIVDTFTKNGTVLREHWGSCRLATDRYYFYNKRYDIPVSFYSYHPLSAANAF